MSRMRSLASIVAVSALVVPPLLVGCATGGRPTAPPTAAAPAPAEPVATTEPAAVAAEPITAATPSYPDCPSAPHCGDDCDNWPYRPTDCKTTAYGPAKADVVLAGSNLIMCTGGTYALCFFSGPQRPSGTNPDNNSLPCVLGDDDPGTADCSCQAYTNGLPWFVDINGILNLGAWYQAVEECGPTGESCFNLAACGPDGSKCAGNTTLKTPSICAYIQNQGTGNAEGWLMPQGDLISTFSFAMANDYSMVPQTDCTDVPSPFYAGCMTAPCFYPEGTPEPPPDGTIVHCQCPTYHGPYQVGQTGQACSIPHNAGVGYVWSASYNPNAKGGS